MKIRSRYGPPRAAVVLIGTTLAGCGANVQAVHDGEVRFERCAALDFEARAPRSERLRCWEEWLEAGPLGQTRERLAYAARRRSELAVE